MAVEVEQRTKALDKRDGAAARVGDAVLACAAALPREHLVQDAVGKIPTGVTSAVDCRGPGPVVGAPRIARIQVWGCFANPRFDRDAAMTRPNDRTLPWQHVARPILMA
jgi:hypothetical protein